MREKLTATHPRPAASDRPPVRPGSPGRRRDTLAREPSPTPPVKKQRAAKADTAGTASAAKRGRRTGTDSGASASAGASATRTRGVKPAPVPAKAGATKGAGPRPAAPDRKVGVPARAVQSGHAAPVHSTQPGEMRLSKRMSELGLASRREADEWIEKGWVLVDGERVTTLGIKVRPDQHIEIVEQARAAQQRLATILLHKPVGYVSAQPEDGHAPAVSLILPTSRWALDTHRQTFSAIHLRNLAPAGRLDIDSTGLLVLTQDGRIAKALIGQDSSIEKEYLVRVSYGSLTDNVRAHVPERAIASLRHGLTLDDKALLPAEVDWQNAEQLRFVLREGRKRQIRRMCELVGLTVIGLKRVRIGNVMLGHLPAGEWRYLAENETFL